MKRVFREYFSHLYIWIYLVITLVMWGYIYNCGILVDKLYLFLLLVVVPFYEWTLHKFILHAHDDNESAAKKKYMYRLHRGHHEKPKEVELLFAPISAGLFIPAKFFLLALIFSQSLEIAIYISAISLSYYLYYEWIHLAHHIDEYKPITSWGTKLKKAHQWHHFKNENYWWGVTTSIGDKLLGTYPKPNKIKKSSTVKELFV